MIHPRMYRVFLSPLPKHIVAYDAGYICYAIRGVVYERTCLESMTHQSYRQCNGQSVRFKCSRQLVLVQVGSRHRSECSVRMQQIVGSGTSGVTPQVKVFGSNVVDSWFWYKWGHATGQSVRFECSRQLVLVQVGSRHRLECSVRMQQIVGSGTSGVTPQVRVFGSSVGDSWFWYKWGHATGQSVRFKCRRQLVLVQVGSRHRLECSVQVQEIVGSGTSGITPQVRVFGSNVVDSWFWYKWGHATGQGVRFECSRQLVLVQVGSRHRLECSVRMQQIVGSGTSGVTPQVRVFGSNVVDSWFWYKWGHATGQSVRFECSRSLVLVQVGSRHRSECSVRMQQIVGSGTSEVTPQVRVFGSNVVDSWFWYKWGHATGQSVRFECSRQLVLVQVGSRHRLECSVRMQQIVGSGTSGVTPQVRVFGSNVVDSWFWYKWGHATGQSVRFECSRQLVLVQVGSRHRLECSVRMQQIVGSGTSGVTPQVRVFGSNVVDSWFWYKWGHTTGQSVRFECSRQLVLVQVGSRHRLECSVRMQQIVGSGTSGVTPQVRVFGSNVVDSWFWYKWGHTTGQSVRFECSRQLVLVQVGSRHRLECSVRMQQIVGSGTSGVTPQVRVFGSNVVDSWFWYKWGHATGQSVRFECSRQLVLVQVRSRHRSECSVRMQQIVGSGTSGVTPQVRVFGSNVVDSWFWYKWGHVTGQSVRFECSRQLVLVQVGSRHRLECSVRMQQIVGSGTVGSRHRSECSVRMQQIVGSGTSGVTPQVRVFGSNVVDSWFWYKWGHATGQSVRFECSGQLVLVQVGSRHRLECSVRMQQIVGSGTSGVTPQVRVFGSNVVDSWFWYKWGHATGQSVRFECSRQLVLVQVGSRHRLECSVRVQEIVGSGTSGVTPQVRVFGSSVGDRWFWYKWGHATGQSVRFKCRRQLVLVQVGSRHRLECSVQVQEIVGSGTSGVTPQVRVFGSNVVDSWFWYKWGHATGQGVRFECSRQLVLVQVGSRHRLECSVRMQQIVGSGTSGVTPQVRVFGSNVVDSWFWYKWGHATGQSVRFECSRSLVLVQVGSRHRSECSVRVQEIVGSGTSGVTPQVRVFGSNVVDSWFWYKWGHATGQSVRFECSRQLVLVQVGSRHRLECSVRMQWIVGSGTSGVTPQVRVFGSNVVDSWFWYKWGHATGQSVRFECSRQLVLVQVGSRHRLECSVRMQQIVGYCTSGVTPQVRVFGSSVGDRWFWYKWGHATGQSVRFECSRQLVLVQVGSRHRSECSVRVQEIVGSGTSGVTPQTIKLVLLASLLSTQLQHCRVPEKEWSFQDGGRASLFKVGLVV